MRLYLDHDVDVALAERLRQGGHDVLTTREVGHAESLDEQQLAFATREERAFVTIIVEIFVGCIVSGLQGGACVAVSSSRPICLLKN